VHDVIAGDDHLALFAAVPPPFKDLLQLISGLFFGISQPVLFITCLDALFGADRLDIFLDLFTSAAESIELISPVAASS